MTRDPIISIKNKGLKKNTLLLATLVVMLLMALGTLSTGAQVFAFGGRLAFLALCLFALRSVTIREVLLLCGAGLLTLWVLTSGAGIAVVYSALDLAAFFAVFIAALTAIRDVAARSRSVTAVGRFLTGQPAGRRFYATALGGHALGVFMNFGAVSLMGPMVQKAAVTPAGVHDPDLERRQISALIRGFTWVIIWAPTTLAQALLLTIFTDISWRDVAPAGLGVAAMMVVIGRLYDRWEWRGRAMPGPAAGAAPPRRAIAVVAVICAMLIASSFVLGTLAGFTVAQSLVFVAPAISVLWLMIQPVHISRLADSIDVFVPSAGPLARSAIALGVSGYIGRLAALSLPVEYWANLLDIESMPGWLFLAILPVIITLGGQIALSPIMIVVFIGQLLQGLASLPAATEHVFLALSIGWALGMTASPNATATLLISGACNIPATRLTWSWNLRYGLVCYAAAVALFMIIA